MRECLVVLGVLALLFVVHLACRRSEGHSPFHALSVSLSARRTGSDESERLQGDVRVFCSENGVTSLKTIPDLLEVMRAELFSRVDRTRMRWSQTGSFYRSMPPPYKKLKEKKRQLQSVDENGTRTLDGEGRPLCVFCPEEFRTPRLEQNRCRLCPCEGECEPETIGFGVPIRREYTNEFVLERFRDDPPSSPIEWDTIERTSNRTPARNDARFTLARVDGKQDKVRRTLLYDLVRGELTEDMNRRYVPHEKATDETFVTRQYALENYMTREDVFSMPLTEENRLCVTCANETSATWNTTDACGVGSCTRPMRNNVRVNERQSFQLDPQPRVVASAKRTAQVPQEEGTDDEANLFVLESTGFDLVVTPMSEFMDPLIQELHTLAYERYFSKKSFEEQYVPRNWARQTFYNTRDPVVTIQSRGRGEGERERWRNDDFELCLTCDQEWGCVTRECQDEGYLDRMRFIIR
jgi:hypothetical protein